MCDGKEAIGYYYFLLVLHFEQVRIDADDSLSVVNYETLLIDPTSGTTNTNLEVKSLTLSYGEDASTKRMYALTPSIIVGLPLFDCSQHTTCLDCLGSKDPFCGWCTLENK